MNTRNLNTSLRPFSRAAKISPALLFALTVKAFAMGADIGDATPPVPGHPIIAWHSTLGKYNKTYSNGHAVNNKAQMRAFSNLLRFVYPFYWGPVVADIQFGVATADLKGNRSSGIDDQAKGMTDPFVAMPLYFILDADKLEYFVLAPFLFLPLGDYNPNKNINTGENRWHSALQAIYQRRLVGRFNLEVLGEANFYSKNNRLGPDDAELKQDPAYLTHVAFSYDLGDSRHTRIGAGVQHRWGGETTIDGQSMNDRTAYTAGFVQVLTFLGPVDQVLFGYSHDFKVENGFRVDREFKFRYAHGF